MAEQVVLLPRFLRAKHAHTYCGMARELFNIEIRPQVTEIPIGKQGIAFDRLELDTALDDYKSRNGRPAKFGGRIWEKENHQVSRKGMGSGISTKSFTDKEFAKALEQATSKKPNAA